MTAEERVILIQEFCRRELSKVPPNDLEIVKIAITYQIKEAVEEATRGLLKTKPLEDMQVPLIKIRKRKR